MTKNSLLTIVFVYGLLIGSFFNVCISRIPKGLSIVFPSSHCPNCKAKIKWWYNIPLLSYILLRGRCFSCNKKISIIYPFVELLTALIAFSVFYKFYSLDHTAFLVKSSIYFIFLGSLLISSFVDLKYFIIPDRFTIGGIFFGVMASTIYPQLHGFNSSKEGFIFSFVSFLICFSVLNVVRVVGTLCYKREAMGFGDIKLVGAFGAIMGWKLGLLAIFFASIVGSVFGVVSIIFSHNKLKSEIPFGPYLSVGAYVSLLFGNEFLLLYKNYILF